jgi:hypothetical protein
MFAEFNVIHKNSIHYYTPDKVRLDMKRIVEVQEGYLEEPKSDLEGYSFSRHETTGTRVIRIEYKCDSHKDLYFIEYSDETLKKIESNYYFVNT